MTRQPGLQLRLDAIARALNCDDFTAAMIAAVHTRTPELSSEAAIRLANAEHKLTKYNYNPDEPRDWYGRWTTDGSADGINPAAPRGSADGQAALATSGDDSLVAINVAMEDEMMRRIVKNACIAECSESSLQNTDHGWKSFNCLNDCLRRHGFDPFSVLF